MNLGTRAEPLRNEILSHPEFIAASYSNRLPPNLDWYWTVKVPGHEENYLLAAYTMDYDHQAVMGFKMLQGRFFSRDFRSDTTAVILNEAAARQLGISELDAQKIGFTGDEAASWTVIGIVKDFNFETLKSSIRPLMMVLGSTPNWDIAIRLAPGNTSEQIELLKSIWKKYIPEAPFEYSFVDQNFDAKFRAEQQLSNVILVFTGLAIFIASLGLFGLATFTAQRRSKEIGIRKVMGASVTQVVLLLSRNFTPLILTAFVIATPVSWYGMNLWLQGFAYHIDYSFAISGIAGGLALAIALLTVSFQSIRAAMQNPVNSLKSE
jgi:putative ABC transport system permease protein